jgi:hypothetical protein
MLNIPNPLLIRVVSTYLYTPIVAYVRFRTNIFFALNLIGKNRYQLSTETPKNPDFGHEKRPILTIIKTGKNINDY